MISTDCEGCLSKIKNRPEKKKGEKKKKKKNKDSLNRGFWKGLLKLLRIAVPGILTKEAALFFIQFIFLLFRTFITVRVSKLSIRFLTEAIARASWKHWARWLINFLSWMVFGTLTNVGLKYLEDRIALSIREKLTKHCHKYYMKSNAFYKASVLQKGGLRNIDQRICADIKEFSTRFAHLYGHSFKPVLEFFLTMNECVVELGAGRLMSFFFLQTLISLVFRSFMPRMGPMIAKEAEMEGNFRHAHARLNAHAEEIAFLRGSEREESILNDVFQKNVDIRTVHSLKKFSKWIMEQFLKFQGPFIGGIFVHVPFLMMPEISEVERISRFRETESLMLKSGGAFTEIILIQHHFQEIAGYVTRVTELLDLLEKDLSQVDYEVKEISKKIRFNNLTVQTPEINPRTLVKDLTLEIQEGQSFLVTGPNGCGKTSLFRTLAGLWQPVSGSVECPSKNIMWVPQKPYLVMGTLRDQVTYPKIKGFHEIDDSFVAKCLVKAGLQKKLDNPEGLDLCPLEWNDIFSGGERQRIGFARLYFHQPRFCVLDEATSAINPDEEELLYQQVLDLQCTVFSIAHRLELRKFHQFELKIFGDNSGGFTVEKLNLVKTTKTNL